MKYTFLGFLFALLFITCKENKPEEHPLSSQDIVKQFYQKHKDFDFESFQCFVITDDNRTIGKRGDSYDIMCYENCAEENNYPKIGHVSYKGIQSTYVSDKLPEDELPTELLDKFRALELASINYKNHRQLLVSPLPEIVIMKRCGPPDPGYLSLDNCWHYKILR